MKATAISILIALSLTLSIKAAEKPETATGAESAIPETFNPKDLDVLRDKKGTVVTVEGRIARSGESRSGTHRYLNFTDDYKKSVSLVFAVFKDSVAFSNEKIKPWVGKKVHATGKLTEYKDNLQIEITSWDQIKAVEIPAEEPSPAEEAK